MLSSKSVNLPSNAAVRKEVVGWLHMSQRTHRLAYLVGSCLMTVENWLVDRSWQVTKFRRKSRLLLKSITVHFMREILEQAKRSSLPSWKKSKDRGQDGRTLLHNKLHILH